VSGANGSTTARKKFHKQKLIFWTGGAFLLTLISALGGAGAAASAAGWSVLQ
jgi:uncharacterized membrane protein YvbJ